MVNVQRAIAGYIKVVSHPNVRPDRPQQAPEPDVGARWGKPAVFENLSQMAKAEQGVSTGVEVIIENDPDDKGPLRRETISAGVGISFTQAILEIEDKICGGTDAYSRMSTPDRVAFSYKITLPRTEISDPTGHTTKYSYRFTNCTLGG